MVDMKGLDFDYLKPIEEGPADAPSAPSLSWNRVASVGLSQGELPHERLHGPSS